MRAASDERVAFAHGLCDERWQCESTAPESALVSYIPLANLGALQGKRAALRPLGL